MSMEGTMTDWPKELLELFEDPLLDGVRPKPAPVTADDRTKRKIEELKQWIAESGCEPQMDSKSIKEKLMAVSLQTLKELGLWT